MSNNTYNNAHFLAAEMLELDSPEQLPPDLYLVIRDTWELSSKLSPPVIRPFSVATLITVYGSMHPSSPGG